jgi:hypothetical protein
VKGVASEKQMVGGGALACYSTPGTAKKDRRLFAETKGLAMSKAKKTEGELKLMALEEIRRYRNCESVAEIGIHPINDNRVNCNWSISVKDLGSADGDTARRAAIEVQERLSSEFDLIEPD